MSAADQALANAAASAAVEKLPESLNYLDIKPLSVPSASQRRVFLPTNAGGSYKPGGSNIIRFALATAQHEFIDFQHSYVQYTVRNNAAADTILTGDFGTPFFNRVRWEAGGQQLEQIDAYNTLSAMALYSQQSPGQVRSQATLQSNQSERLMNDLDFAQTVGTSAGPSPNRLIVKQAAITADLKYPPPTANYETAVGAGATFNPGVRHGCGVLAGSANEIVYVTPILGAIGQQEKLFPSGLLGAGALTCEITLEAAANVGVTVTSTSDANAVANDYEISDIRYVCQVVSLDQSFVDSLRAQIAERGSLSMYGSTFRHYSGSIAANSSDVSINIPCRASSVQSLFTSMRANNLATIGSSTVGINNRGSFSVGVCQYWQVEEFNYRIGTQMMPATPCPTRQNQMAVPFQELMKAWGVSVASLDYNTCCSTDTFYHNGEQTVDGAAVPYQQRRPVQVRGTSLFTAESATAKTDTVENPGASSACTFIMATDLQAYNTNALESGVDTSSGLDITFECKMNPNVGVALSTSHYAMCDLALYLDASGQMTAAL